MALVSDLEFGFDRGMIEDALVSKLVDSELSEPQLQSMTSAAAEALRESR